MTRERLWISNDFQPAYKDNKVKVTVGVPTPSNLFENSTFKNVSDKQWQDYLNKHDG